jgi:glutamine synthetase
MNEPLMAVCIGDIAGQVRAKAIPVAMRESRFLSGVGWTPTNVQITCFDVIADSPYGPFGDVLMVPDPATELRIGLGAEAPGEHFVLADIVEPGGKVWDCRLRSMLKAALADLKSETDRSIQSHSSTSSCSRAKPIWGGPIHSPDSLRASASAN